MPKYVVEQEMPGVGRLTAAELQAVSRNSSGVLAVLGPQIQWVESYVTEDKIYSVCIALNEELVWQHAWQTGIPVNRVEAVVAIIDPATGEG